MREQRKIMTALALTMMAVLLLVALAAAVQGAPAAERPEGWSEHQVNAHNVAQQMRAMGYAEDNPVIVACQEWWREERENGPSQSPQAATALPASGASQEYTTKEQRAEYPEASYVWQLLKEAGLSDIHAAAILGNAMAESGGHTLNINVYQDVGGYWGAWAMSKVYYADVVGQGADAQVAKILETLGEGFYQTTDVRSAARWFSDNWERPAHWSEVRADNAERALKYFGGAQ